MVFLSTAYVKENQIVNNLDTRSYKNNDKLFQYVVRARSLGVSDLRSETLNVRFEFGH